MPIEPTEPSAPTRADVVALVALVVFFVALFHDVLFGDRYLLVGDPIKQLYPLRVVAWEMIRGGSLPLWSPHILSGYPLSAMIMLGIGYPLTWGYFFTSGPWAEQAYVLAPYFLAPLFTYVFLREIRRSVVASLFGALVFGYGGFLFSPIGLTGVHANSALWLPLVLYGVARARRAPLASSLAIAAVAYALSILAGSGQIFLYGGALALAYGVFLALFPDNGRAPARVRWQPPLVAAASIVVATALTAWQMLETWTAVGESVRRAYPVERFSEGSFTPMLAWRSLLQPLGNFWDSSTFVPLLAVALAFVAVGAALRRPRDAAQVFFWFVAAIVAWLLILGKHTPLFDIYAQLPLVKRFRYPARHSLEWSLAIGVLAAYGWDTIERLLARRAAADRSRAGVVAGAGIALVVAAIIAIRWGGHITAAGLAAIHDIGMKITELDSGYLGWKIAFTLVVAAALALISSIPTGIGRTALLAAAIGFYCFVEPYLWMVRPLVVPFSVSPAMFGSFGETTNMIRNEIAPHERTFSVIHPYVVHSDPNRIADAVNWTALAGFEDANGYESLILGRYVRAFRGEAVDAEPFIFPERRLVDEKSHVLDLLAIRYVIAYDGIDAGPRPIHEKDGLEFSIEDLGVGLSQGEKTTLAAAATEADTLLLVTTMAHSGNIEDGQPVARLAIHGAGGEVVEPLLRGGVHTAEWAHDRPDVQATVKHSRAPIFDSGPADDGTWHSHRYLARIPLGERLRVIRIDAEMIAPEAGLSLWKASLHDSTTGRSQPLPEPPLSRWETIYEKDRITIMKNRRAMPRAWLVGSVEALQAEEILRRIRGESEAAFDPRRTALVELDRREIPPLPGRLSDDARVRIVTREPTRIMLETTTREPAMLVVSEIHYPGWMATVDGAEVPIHQTNYLLRGVFVPAGRHTVGMVYKPAGLRRGAAVSLMTLLLIGAAVVFGRVRREGRRDSGGRTF